ncbi:MAG: hypothetical protein C0392_01170 [Syntrophus sp. (in: bacteria)]|nr:hypothetical protein [Syntrophus sp. (in: bacteria)]
MINFEMNEDEAKLLLNVLENYLLHLGVEIHRTHRREFREALNERERSLQAVTKRLKQITPEEKTA